MVTPLLLAYLVLYLVVPLVFVVSWFIDLWAKSYDIPVAQVLAKACLSVLLGLAAAGYTWVAGLMLDEFAQPVAMLAIAVALISPAVALVWTVYDVNWRTVYAGTAIGPLAIWAPAPGSAFATGLVMTVVAGIVACWVYNE